MEEKTAAEIPEIFSTIKKKKELKAYGISHLALR